MTKLSLTNNLRVSLNNDSTALEFSRNLLRIGNGQVNHLENNEIDLSFLGINFVTENSLGRSVFPNLFENYKNVEWLAERAILASTNEAVNEINN